MRKGKIPSIIQTHHALQQEASSNVEKASESVPHVATEDYIHSASTSGKNNFHAQDPEKGHVGNMRRKVDGRTTVSTSDPGSEVQIVAPFRSQSNGRKTHPTKVIPDCRASPLSPQLRGHIPAMERGPGKRGVGHATICQAHTHRFGGNPVGSMFSEKVLMYRTKLAINL